MGRRVGVSGDAESLTRLLFPASMRDGGLLCAGVDSAEARRDEFGTEEASGRSLIESATTFSRIEGWQASRLTAFVELTSACNVIQVWLCLFCRVARGQLVDDVRVFGVGSLSAGRIQLLDVWGH